MGEREIFLVMAAILFFTMTSISVNRFCLNNSEVMMESEFNYYAISLAQRIIEEAKTKYFDEIVITQPTKDKYNFTGSLKPEGEYYDQDPYFDDVDDYNGLKLPVTADLNGPKVNYDVMVQVGYVRETDLNTIQMAEKTFYKKMIVTVTSSFIPDTVKLSHVFTYVEY